DIQRRGGIGFADAHVTRAPLDHEFRAAAKSNIIYYETVAGASHHIAGLRNSNIPHAVGQTAGARSPGGQPDHAFGTDLRSVAHLQRSGRGSSADADLAKLIPHERETLSGISGRQAA